MSGLITGDFVFSVEREYRVLSELNYRKLFKKLWYPKVTKVHNTNSKQEIYEWLLDTATIDQLSPQDGGEESGNLDFEETSSVLKTISPAHHGKGYRIDKMRWENSLNRGMDPVERWIAAQSLYRGYYPQKQVAIQILNGETTIGYDGVAFFSKSHPVNPNIPGLGTFANLFTGAAVAQTPGVVGSGYPGALPIDDSVDVNTALTNLTKAVAYVTGAVAQPNGQDPRNLEVAYILHPPRMEARVAQLTKNAKSGLGKLIAQAVGAAGGSADVSDIIESLNIAETIKVPEFDGNRTYFFGPRNMQSQVSGDDKAWYLVCREAEESELGAILMNKRQDFTMQYYSGEAGADGLDAVLGRSQKMEWHHQAYMGFDVGHPYTIYKFKGT